MKYNIVLFIFLLLVLKPCQSQTETKKINGLSFVASPQPIDDSHTNSVVNVGANYCAIMPFGFIKKLEHPEIIHNTERQWFGETRAGANQYIKELEKRGIAVMIKPQIWVWHGEYTGFIEMTNETDWKTLEDSYTNFIMEYANLATEVNASIFCIGTELEKFVANRPEYWKSLICKIKDVYNGKLTYAANWDEYKRTPFWEELDYIGIDAYFPVSESKTPTVKECIEGWRPHKAIIKDVSEKYNRPIIFTEFGYRSVDYTGKEPWRSDRSMKMINLEGQSNATKALLSTFWDEDWFAGGFIWKWFHNHADSGGEQNNQFTPQNKPVEELIKYRYSKE